MSHQPSLRQYTPGYRLLFAFAVPWLVASIVVTMDIILHPLQPEGFYGSVPFRLASGLLFAPLTILVGALCVRHSPGNIVGILLMLVGTGTSLSCVRTDVNPLVLNVVAIGGVVVFWVTFLLLLLYFPDGKPYFRRAGSWLGKVIALFMGVSFVTLILARPQLSFSAPGVDKPTNPWHMPALEDWAASLTSLFPVVISVYIMFVLVSLVARYRASGTRERNQLKWFLYGVAIWVLPQLLNSLPGAPSALSDAVGVYGIVGAGLLPAITVGPAILLNQLWDINIIIRRTIVYSVLTVVLSLFYWGGVVGFQTLLRPVVGEGNDLAIVATTLLIAALFLPLRRTIQRFIDRRFYRRKYDAARTLEQFGQVARDEVDLQTLTGRLMAVVDDTMQPAHVSLWLRSPKNRS